MNINESCKICTKLNTSKSLITLSPNNLLINLLILLSISSEGIKLTNKLCCFNFFFLMKLGIRNLIDKVCIYVILELVKLLSIYNIEQKI